MKFLRRVIGITRRNCVRNQQVKEELETPSVLEFVEQRQWDVWGYLQRMKSERPYNLVWKARIKAKRCRGKRPEMWDSMMGRGERNGARQTK